MEFYEENKLKTNEIGISEKIGWNRNLYGKWIGNFWMEFGGINEWIVWKNLKWKINGQCENEMNKWHTLTHNSLTSCTHTDTHALIRSLTSYIKSLRCNCTMYFFLFFWHFHIALCCYDWRLADRLNLNVILQLIGLNRK